MPRHASRTALSQKLGGLGNVALFGLILVALAALSFVWPALWSELVREESMILGIVGDLLDLRQLLGLSVALTFVIALLRTGGSDPSELVFPVAGILAGIAIAGGGWSAPLGLAGIAVAVLARRGSTGATGGDVD